MPACRSILFVILLPFCLTSCTEAPVPSKGSKPTAKTSEGAGVKTGTGAPAVAPATAGEGWSGKIVETMNSGGYSYALMDTGSEKKWVAGPLVTGLAVGQTISVTQPMTMNNFSSGSLNRNFPVIYFVTGIETKSGVKASATSKPSTATGEKPALAAKGNKKARDAEKAAPVAKAEGGFTIAELHAQKDSLSGKTVKVRGRVAKFMPKIMGTNWLHIEDGSVAGEAGKLRVTSNATATAGEVVVVEGTLTTNKDFGFGYAYKVLIENAKVVKDKKH